MGKLAHNLATFAANRHASMACYLSAAAAVVMVREQVFSTLIPCRTGGKSATRDAWRYRPLVRNNDDDGDYSNDNGQHKKQQRQNVDDSCDETT